MSLKKLTFLTRNQLQVIHQLGKKRNTNRVLGELSPWLSSFREGYDTVYYLNALGREYVGSKKVLKKNQFVKHILMRNDFYIYSGFPSYWKNEMKIGDRVDSRVCDSFFKANEYYYILEVDSKQMMNENKKKIESYKGILERGALTDHFGYFPPLIWLTTTEHRRSQLKELCKDIPSEVYTLEDIK